MLDLFTNTFPQLKYSDCLTSLTDSEFYIYDHETEKRCYLQDDERGIKHFRVTNTSENAVHFLAIDKCLLMDDAKTQRCDCAVFNEHTLCLIEIKSTSSMTQRKKLRREAKDQLKATVTYLRQVLNLTTVIEAYVCLLAESDTRPLNRASLVEEEEEFDAMGVSLFHLNHKHFA
ncbi:hypothetical protein [Spirosoma rhododendri]|uniref:Uncharacterized protein n=1 Tax=Spirosoma rhododendri TaxID=2728024 RepID=A0A7L5DTY9_9BACT|nr:hypothetical protein [Spirosoma rhododendri]QJD79030.1 hypothetical protein HH216_11795 [Spirosoma rhododendri]